MIYYTDGTIVEGTVYVHMYTNLYAIFTDEGFSISTIFYFF